MSFCSTCGHEILKKSKFRPAFYCSDNCRDYYKYKNAIEKILISIEPTSECLKVIRGDMFRLSNILSNGTKTKLSKGGLMK